MMDLTKIEGLTTEMIEAITAQVNDEVKGLKSKNEELLGKLSNGKSEQEALLAQAEEARKLASEKEEARLKATNDIEGLRKHYEAELAEKTALLSSANQNLEQTLIGRDVDAFKADVMAKVADSFKFAGSALLDSCVTAKLDPETNKTVIEAKIGDEVFTDSSSFIGKAMENENWKAILAAPKNSGGSAQTSTSQASLSNRAPVSAATSNYLNIINS